MARSRSLAKTDRFGSRWKPIALALLGLCLAGAAALLGGPALARYRTAREFARAQQLRTAGQDGAASQRIRTPCRVVVETPVGKLPLRSTPPSP